MTAGPSKQVGENGTSCRNRFDLTFDFRSID
jgi:hypothetical protein